MRRDSDRVEKIQNRLSVCNETKQCSYCRPHRNENVKKIGRKHKSIDRKSIRFISQ